MIAAKTSNMIHDSGANQSILRVNWHIVSQYKHTTTVKGWATAEDAGETERAATNKPVEPTTKKTMRQTNKLTE